MSNKRNWELIKLAIDRINDKLEKMSEEERENYMNDLIKKLEGD
jgi:hypothetical protein